MTNPTTEEDRKDDVEKVTKFLNHGKRVVAEQQQKGHHVAWFGRDGPAWDHVRRMSEDLGLREMKNADNVMIGFA